ncbi:MAG: glucose PTS transporter subunit IIA [Micrococcaceae bacterium]
MTSEQIFAPSKGRIIPITEVEDPVFSEKMMGDGFAVEPETDDIYSPISGEVMLVSETKHAIGLKSASGIEVLLHMGIDTVELKGEPFTLTVSVGDIVQAGDHLGMMNLAKVSEAGKKSTIITVVTEPQGAEVNIDAARASKSEAVATVEVPTTETTESSTSSSTAPLHTEAAAVGATGAAAAGTAVATQQQTTSTVPSGDKYDVLGHQLVEDVGGPSNIDKVVHCITRVRFYLKDESKANDEAIKNLDGVIDVAKAGGQYQVVIGPAVRKVYAGVLKTLGSDDGALEGNVEKKQAPQGFVPALKYYFSELIGVITASMIPVIGLLAASGILKGILALLITFHLTDDKSSTYTIINAMGDAVFYFLPIFVGFTAARRLGANPIIVAIIGGVMTYPSIIQAAGVTTGPKFLGLNMNADFFGIPIHMVSYTYSIFPIIAAAFLAAKLEPVLEKYVPLTLQMIFNPLIEVFVVSLAVFLILGPVISAISAGIASVLMFLYNLNSAIAGLIIGGFYQVLVIFGLHWAVIPIVTNQISMDGSSPLNAIISASMLGQAGAVMAIFFKTRTKQLKELTGAATISALCGVTEPAVYGANLKYGRAFMTGCIGAAAGGFLTGLLHVNMWGFTGSLIGFTSFINPKGLDGSFWGFLIATATTLVVSFVATWMFGFSESDVENEKAGREKVRLGSREPVVR